MSTVRSVRLIPSIDTYDEEISNHNIDTLRKCASNIKKEIDVIVEKIVPGLKVQNLELKQSLDQHQKDIMENFNKRRQEKFRKYEQQYNHLYGKSDYNNSLCALKRTTEMQVLSKYECESILSYTEDQDFMIFLLI